MINGLEDSRYHSNSQYYLIYVSNSGKLDCLISFSSPIYILLTMAKQIAEVQLSWSDNHEPKDINHKKNIINQKMKNVIS